MKRINQTLNFLASTGPLANTTVSGDEADGIMLATGGSIMARGSLYNIKCEQLSPKVFKLSLERTNP